MDDYTWEHDTGISPSDLSVDDILAEFQQDLFADSELPAAKPAPVLVTGPVSGEEAVPAEADPAAWADSIAVSDGEAQTLAVPEKDVEEFLNPEEDSEFEDEVLPYARRERTPRAAGRGGQAAEIAKYRSHSDLTENP